MDGALLLISATENVLSHKQENTGALQIAGINNIVIVQNKMILFQKKELESYNEIKQFVKVRSPRKHQLFLFQPS